MLIFSHILFLILKPNVKMVLTDIISHKLNKLTVSEHFRKLICNM